MLRITAYNQLSDYPQVEIGPIQEIGHANQNLASRRAGSPRLRRCAINDRIATQPNDAGGPTG